MDRNIGLAISCTYHCKTAKAKVKQVVIFGIQGCDQMVFRRIWQKIGLLQCGSLHSLQSDVSDRVTCTCSPGKSCNWLPMLSLMLLSSAPLSSAMFLCLQSYFFFYGVVAVRRRMRSTAAHRRTETSARVILLSCGLRLLSTLPNHRTISRTVTSHHVTGMI